MVVILDIKLKDEMTLILEAERRGWNDCLDKIQKECPISFKKYKLGEFYL